MGAEGVGPVEDLDKIKNPVSFLTGSELDSWS
jgi:hypothetical protein